MAVEEAARQAEQSMSKAVEHLKNEYKGVRTGRASPGLVDNMPVEVASYGSTMRVRELANVAVAEGNVIVIKPFDPTTLKDIERAIDKSGLGINPQSDGKMLRLPVPALSGERRNQLVSQVKQMAEAQKVAIRNARRDANKLIETAKKDKTLPEDEAAKGEDRVQKLTDKYSKQIDELLEQKSAEIMEV